MRHASPTWISRWCLLEVGLSSKYRQDALLIVLTILRSKFIVSFLFGCSFRRLAAFCQSENNPTASNSSRRVGWHTSLMWNGFVTRNSLRLYCNEQHTLPLGLLCWVCDLVANMHVRRVTFLYHFLESNFFGLIIKSMPLSPLRSSVQRLEFSLTRSNGSWLLQQRPHYSYWVYPKTLPQGILKCTKQTCPWNSTPIWTTLLVQGTVGCL